MAKSHRIFLFAAVLLLFGGTPRGDAVTFEQVQPTPRHTLYDSQRAPFVVVDADDEIGHGEFGGTPLARESGLSREALIARSLKRTCDAVAAAGSDARLLLWHDLLAPDRYKSSSRVAFVDGEKLVGLVPSEMAVAIWDYGAGDETIALADDFGKRLDREQWLTTFQAEYALRVASFAHLEGATGLFSAHWHEAPWCTWNDPRGISAAAMNAAVTSASAAWNPEADAAGCRAAWPALGYHEANSLSLNLRSTIRPEDAVTAIVYLGNTTPGQPSYYLTYHLPTVGGAWTRIVLPLDAARTERKRPVAGASKFDTIMISFWHRNIRPVDVWISDLTIGSYVGPEIFNTVPVTPTRSRLTNVRGQ